MTKNLLFVRQQCEAEQLAGAAALVAPTGETEVIHLVPDPTVPSTRSSLVVDATVRALLERGVPARGTVLQAGHLGVAGSIRHLIETEQPELLVLGARRLGRVGALLQGSVTQQVLNGCSTMALVVPGDATVFEPPLRRVLIAVGGDDDLGRLKIAALRLARDAEYLLVHVARRIAVHTVGAGGPYFEIGETSEPELDEVAHALEGSGRRVRRSLLPAARSVSGAIAEAARKSSAELVVVGSNRPGPFRTLTATSTSREVLTQVALPVLFAPVP
jgi:nucleotide-binding universal stress UspA family protein